MFEHFLKIIFSKENRVTKVLLLFQHYFYIILYKERKKNIYGECGSKKIFDSFVTQKV